MRIPAGYGLHFLVVEPCAHMSGARFVIQKSNTIGIGIGGSLAGSLLALRQSLQVRPGKLPEDQAYTCGEGDGNTFISVHTVALDIGHRHQKLY